MTASTSQPDLPDQAADIGPKPERPEGYDRSGRARAAHRGYYRWLRLSRLLLGAFVIIAALTILWLVPWVPSGLDTQDYTPQMAFTVYLLGGAFLTGMLALTLRELARRDRESLLVWTSVYDEATGLHNRTYLFDRLALECDRAKRGGRAFSLIVLHIRLGQNSDEETPTPSRAILQEIGDLLHGLTHTTDVVAVLTSSELAIVAIGADPKGRHVLVHRLEQEVERKLTSLLHDPVVVHVKGGSATFGVDGSDAGTLVHAARTDALLTPPQRKAA